MEYRTLPRGGEQISVIGLGMGSIHNASPSEIVHTLHEAMDAGVNYFDYVPSDAAAFEPYARALHGRRDKVMLQVHLGADYSNGQYGWAIRNPKLAIAQFEERLRDLGTDYADFGFIHCIDEDDDFDTVMNGALVGIRRATPRRRYHPPSGFLDAQRLHRTALPGHGQDGHGHVLAQPHVRLYRRVGLRPGLGQRSREPLPRVRDGRRGHLGHEALRRRPAARRARHLPSARRSRASSASSTRWTNPACSQCCPACAAWPT